MNKPNINFGIKLASKPKIKRNTESYIKIGGKCEAVVIKDNNELKARLTTSPVEDSNEYLVLPFTPNSLNLKGKTHVFAKYKDEYNHRICIIRDKTSANVNPGVPAQYDVLSENLLISGHIVSKDGKKYFNYEKLIAFSEKGLHISEPIVINSNL